MSNEKQRSIGGIWEKETAKGTVLSISLDNEDGTKTNLVAFRNSYKKDGDRMPHWRIFPSRERSQDESAPPPRQGRSYEPPPAQTPPEEVTNEDVPF